MPPLTTCVTLLRLFVAVRRRQKLEVRDLEAMPVLVNNLRKANNTTGVHWGVNPPR